LRFSMPQTKQEKPFGERLKAWFRNSKSTLTRPQDIELQLNSETIHELAADQPVHVRLQTLKELQDLLKERRLQAHGVELLWVKISDLLDPRVEMEVRHSVFEFVHTLVVSQYSNLDMFRAEIFRFLKRHLVDEDLKPRVKLLSALTEDGKDILHFEEEIGRMMIELLRKYTDQQFGDFKDILSLTVNLVKFNSAYLDPDVVSNLVHTLSIHACTTTRDNEIKSILEIFKCVVMYSFVPSEALLQFVSCLCRVVNLKEVCQDAWNTMRSLMGTHLGHSALFNLCVLLQASPDRVDVALVRGAIFFIGSSLWGPQHVPTLKYTAMTVLPVFLVALRDSHPLILYEMALQIESLVMRQGMYLNAPGWEETVTLLEQLVNRLDSCDASLRPTVENHLQATIFKLEGLALNKQYPGSQNRLYDLVEAVSDLCPEQSVLHLLKYRSEHLFPAREGWIEKLEQLMERFYERDVRQAVRIQMLTLLRDTVITNIVSYEDRLLETGVLPFLSTLHAEIDRTVKVKGVQIVSELAIRSTGPHQKDLVDILEKLVRKVLNEFTAAKDTAVLYSRQDFLQFQEAVVGIIGVFKKKFYHPPVASVKRCYDILVNVLEQLYQNTNVIEHTGEIRLELFRCFLSLRARYDFHMGFIRDCAEDGQTCISFSSYVVCEQRKQPGELPPALPSGVVSLSLTRACRAVIRCLKEERDWRVLNFVLTEIPSVLQNKGMLVRYEESISLLAGALCSMVQTNSRLPDINTPSRFGRSDYFMAVYPVLAALASYNRWLDVEFQRKLIKSLEYGLLSRDCNKVCTVALTACILEMSSSMNTFLPEVLLNLSKISATVHIAIPVLEFLSTLISLPKVFASFNNDQYMSVFAITLPYTNPFKFNHYTVSLAHHVIIMWFLKCRLASRRDFVKFIVKGLEGNVLQPFEEGNFRKEELASMNQDSSSRTRSSSLKGESRPQRARHMTGVTSRPQLKRTSGPDQRQALHTFHQELTETCLDIMSRYSFANPAVQPEKCAIADFLLESGNSASWILGTAILTICMSGCMTTAKPGGLCDTCNQYCGHTDPDKGSVTKKRHQSEQSMRTTPLAQLNPLSQDDLGLKEKTEDLMGPDSSRSSFKSNKEEPRLCTCWCQGWCRVLVRRPSGEVSWLCRLQNGQLTNSTDANFLQDITAMLVAETAVKNTGDATRLKVARSNSNPEITELLSDLDLSRIRNNRQSCDPIPEEESTFKSTFNDPPLISPRRRSNTIDTTSPVKSRRVTMDSVSSLQQMKLERSNVISPQFMFLQLYQAAGMSTSYTEKPLVIPKTRQFDTSLKILDMIPCQETHKLGVLYVGEGQADNERAILGNRYGSSRYAAFLNGLGSLVYLPEVNTSKVFLGGLSCKDGDGEFAYVWQEDAMQVVYHTATLMPNRETDPQFNKKKRHIGNDFVSIVYNESGRGYTMGTVKGQFIYAVVLIEPLDFQSNKISVLAKPELAEYLNHLSSGKVVSDHNVSMLVRQIALHCNLAANIFSKLQNKADPYSSNWLERLRHIKRLKGKLLKEKEGEEEDTVHDFTGYCLPKS